MKEDQFQPILVVMRHQTDAIQEMLLRSVHGKHRKIIFEKKTRFDNKKHFLKFMATHHQSYFIYVVIPEDWRDEAIHLGYSIGVLNRPHDVLKKNNMKTRYHIEFYYSEGDFVEKIFFTKVRKRCKRR